MAQKEEIVLDKRNIIEKKENGKKFYMVEFETHVMVKRLFGGYKLKKRVVLDQIRFSLRQQAEEYAEMAERPSRKYYGTDYYNATIFPKQWMEKLRSLGLKEPVIEVRVGYYGGVDYQAFINVNTDNPKRIEWASLYLEELLKKLEKHTEVKRISKKIPEKKKKPVVEKETSLILTDNGILKMEDKLSESDTLHLIRDSIIDAEIKRIEEYKESLLRLKTKNNNNNRTEKRQTND
jgi:hypothetical protein